MGQLSSSTWALLAVALLIAAAELAGLAARRLRQPRVVGIIACGMVLGSVHSALPDELAAAVLPPAVEGPLHLLAQLGLVLLMFVVGQELRPARDGTSTRPPLWVLAANVTVPVALGSLAALPLLRLLTGGRSLAGALFVGLALAVTAVPVLISILGELGATDGRVPRLAVGVAVWNDGIVWMIVTVLVAVGAARGRLDVPRILLAAGALVLVVTVLPRVAAAMEHRAALLPVMLSAAIFGAVATDALGAHAAVGGIVAGLAMPRLAGVESASVTVKAFTEAALLPLFFVDMARQAPLQSLSALTGWALPGAALLLVAAVGSKAVCAAVTGRAAGLRRGDTVALGVLLNCRGVTEFAIAAIGLQAGLVNGTGFAALAVLALLTTCSTTPLLRLLSRRGVSLAPSRAAEQDLVPAA
ncbi:MAG TPA: cation:proton antiporter [Mycobacteriales bacterium]|jgi:Kef-type K+ transport system membrane component KefB|nr:cation:proton antiporter [Mycobacteriales bacterium]